MNSINFTDLTQKMVVLKELHAEHSDFCERVMTGQEVDEARHARYVALRGEVARKLLPLFKDLEETDMLFFWNRGVTETRLSEAGNFGNLGDARENGGVQLTLKE